MPLFSMLQKGWIDPKVNECHTQRPLQVTRDKYFLKVFTTLPKPVYIQLGSH